MQSFIWFGLVALSLASPKLQDCAGDCVGEAVISTGCSSTNSQCICSSDSFIKDIEVCVEDKCSNDQARSNVLDFAADFCDAVGGDSKTDLRKREVEDVEEREISNEKSPSHDKPPSYGHGKPPGYGKPKHHHKCKGHKHPYWSYSAKKCVKECKPGHHLRERGCHKPHKQCKNKHNPFYEYDTKKCVHECKPHYKLRHGECHEHHHHHCHHKKKYFNYHSKKCVHQCPPHYHKKHYGCHPPPSYTTSKPTPPGYTTHTTPTSTNTVY